MKDLKDIYSNLDIPAPSSELEEKIISQAHAKHNKKRFSQLASLAACFLIVIAVWNNDENTTHMNENLTITSDNLL